MKPSVKYGIINGIAGSVWLLLMYITELNRSSSAQIINMFSLIIPIILMVMAINDYRNTEGGGWITFGKAFRQAFTVGIIGGLIGIGFYYIYLMYIDPTLVDFQLQLQQEKFEESGMEESQIEAAMKQTAYFMQPHMQVVFGLVFSIFINSILALIVAAIKKKPDPEAIV